MVGRPGDARGRCRAPGQADVGRRHPRRARRRGDRGPPRRRRPARAAPVRAGPRLLRARMATDDGPRAAASARHAPDVHRGSTRPGSSSSWTSWNARPSERRSSRGADIDFPSPGIRRLALRHPAADRAAGHLAALPRRLARVTTDERRGGDPDLQRGHRRSARSSPRSGPTSIGSSSSTTAPPTAAGAWPPRPAPRWRRTTGTAARASAFGPPWPGRRLSRDVTELVLIDGDGQHDPEDIPRLVAELRQRELDILVGSRFLGTNNAPLYRLFGLHVLTASAGLGSGIYVTDSQSGFRILSRRAIDRLELHEDAFAVESEMQFEAAAKDLRLGGDADRDPLRRARPPQPGGPRRLGPGPHDPHDRPPPSAATADARRDAVPRDPRRSHPAGRGRGAMTSRTRTAAVVVAYNGGDDLLECLRILLAQTVSDLEVIVVDNASTDGSIERAESEFGDAIRVIRRDDERRLCGRCQHRLARHRRPDRRDPQPGPDLRTRLPRGDAASPPRRAA